MVKLIYDAMRRRKRGAANECRKFEESNQQWRKHYC